jgi:hypothetical protein
MERKPTQPSMRRTNMYFSAPQMDKLFAMSAETGLSVAELVRRAVDDYIRRQAGRREKTAPAAKPTHQEPANLG